MASWGKKSQSMKACIMHHLNWHITAKSSPLPCSMHSVANYFTSAPLQIFPILICSSLASKRNSIRNKPKEKKKSVQLSEILFLAHEKKKRKINNTTKYQQSWQTGIKLLYLHVCWCSLRSSAAMCSGKDLSFLWHPSLTHSFPQVKKLNNFQSTPS